MMSSSEKTIRVIFIDDDEDEFVLLEDILSRIKGIKYHVDWVSCYDKGLRQLQTNNHDICLLDHRLGRQTGIDLLGEVEHPRPPIIMLTGLGCLDLDREAIAAGADGFLGKDELSSTLIERIIRHAIERKLIEDDLRAKACFDSLTGLPNRTLFNQRLERACSRLKRGVFSSALLYLDLNKFKEVNDTHGHDVGDFVLIEFARRLMLSVRTHDTVARLGGDEFAIVLENVDCAKRELIIERIHQNMREPFTTNGLDLILSTSVGFSELDASSTPEEALRLADQTMYAFKNKRDCLKHWTATWAG